MQPEFNKKFLPIIDVSQDPGLRACRKIEFQGVECPALGRIALVNRLGKGGMGVVYYGVNPRLGTEVAIKILPQDLLARNEQLLPRFVREAQLSAILNSRNLVAAIDVDEDPATGLNFFVMEYVQGLSAGAWRDALKQQGVTDAPEWQALEVCIGATTGLRAAHLEGIVHRDVKPANIIIPWDKESDPRFLQSKLADLGLARTEESSGMSLTHQEVAMGTPGFMAPEQTVDVKEAKKPADVFGMGATLYYLLSGKPAFAGKSAVEIMMATMKGTYAPIEEVCEGVSPGVAALIQRCLLEDPTQRFPDASALLEGLKRCRESLDSTQGTPLDVGGLLADLAGRTEEGKRVESSSGEERPLEEAGELGTLQPSDLAGDAGPEGSVQATLPASGPAGQVQQTTPEVARPRAAAGSGQETSRTSRTRKLAAVALLLSVVGVGAWQGFFGGWFRGDSTAPDPVTDVLAAPRDLAARADPPSGAIELTWEPVARAQGYLVFRGESLEAEFKALNPDSPAPGGSYGDSSVETDRSYFYRVCAVDPGGARGGMTATVEAQLKAEAAPSTALRLGFVSTLQEQTEGQGNGNVSVLLRLDRKPEQKLIVPYEIEGTAGPDDYRGLTGAFTFGTNEDQKEVSLSIEDDDLDEDDETIVLVLDEQSLAGAGVVLGADRHTITILDDDDPPTVSFSSEAELTKEYIPVITAWLNLDRASGREVRVPFKVDAQTASIPADIAFREEANEVVFAPGEVNKEIVLDVQNDQIKEDNETLVLTLQSSPTAVVAAANRHVITITDDDELPTLAFEEVSSRAAEGAGSVTVRLTLEPASEAVASGRLEVLGGTAQDGLDFELPSSVFTIDRGQTSTEVVVSLTDDLLDELDEEHVVLALDKSSIENARPADGGEHQIIIMDDDDPPLLGFKASSSGQDESQRGLSAELTLSQPSGLEVLGNYDVGGTATQKDYGSFSGSFRIPAGSRGAELAGVLVDDELDELDETITFSLTELTHARLDGDRSAHELTIRDDDPEPTLQFSQLAQQAKEDQGGAVEVELVLNQISGRDVRGVCKLGGDATEGVDYSGFSEEFRIPAGTTSAKLTGVLINDDSSEPEERIVLTLGEVSGARPGRQMEHTITVLDDDQTHDTPLPDLASNLPWAQKYPLFFKAFGNDYEPVEGHGLAVLSPDFPQVIRHQRTGYEFVFVPSGEFDYGCPKACGTHTKGEYPDHPARKADSKASALASRIPMQEHFYIGRREAPFEFVSTQAWSMITQPHAQEVCEFNSWRLPSSREWEYAFSGPDNHLFPGGGDSGSFEDRSWCGAEGMAKGAEEWVQDPEYVRGGRDDHEGNTPVSRFYGKCRSYQRKDGYAKDNTGFRPLLEVPGGP